MAGRVSQLPVEAVIAPTSGNARVSQQPVEAIIAPTSQRARVSQATVEAVVASTDRRARLSQAVVEVVIGGIPKGTFGVESLIVEASVEGPPGVFNVRRFRWADALILAPQTKTFTVAAEIVEHREANFSVDTRIAEWFVVNAVKTQNFPSSFSVDYRWGPGGSFDVSSLRLGTLSSGDPYRDIALGKSGTASSHYFGVVDNITDGSDSTYYETQNGLTNWIRLDLLAAYRIVSFRVYQPGDAAHSRTSFDLQYSLDDSTWVTAYSVTGATAETIVTLPLVPTLVAARYWRIIGVAGGTSGWRVATLSLYIASLTPFYLDAQFSRGHFLLEAWLWFGDANVEASQYGLEAARTGIPNIEVSQYGVEVVVEKPVGTFTADAVLAIIVNPEGSFTVDTWLRGWGTFTVDAWLWTGNAGIHVTQFGIERARTHPAPDILVSQIGLEVARGADPGAQVAQYGVEIAVEVPRGTFVAAASILRPGESMTPATFVVDAFHCFEIVLDAALISSYSSSFAADAAIVRNIEESFTADADICLGMKVDAIFGKNQRAVFAIFAYKVIKTTPTGTVTLDAYKSRFFTVAAWVTKPVTFTVAAAIIEPGKPLKSFPADAILGLPEIGGEFLLEAEISTLRTVVYEAYGSSHLERNLITERLSFPGVQSPVETNAHSLYGPFYPIDLTPVVVTLWDLPAYEGQTPESQDPDIGIQSINENLWYWPYDEGKTHTFWPSYWFEPHYVYCWKNTAYDPTLTGSGMVSYYRDDTVIDALPAPTIDAWLVGTPGEPFTLDAEIVGREKTGWFAVDADLMKAGEQRATFTAGAHLLAPRPFFLYVFAEVAALRFTVDALILRPSFTLDAHIELVGGADAVFTLDATLKATVVPVSTYGKGPTLDAEIVRRTRSSWGLIDAEIVDTGERRGILTLDSVLLGPRPPKRFYLAALVIPDVSFALDAYIGQFMTVDAWVGSTDGGLGGFAVDAYVRGNSIIIFPEDGGPPTDPSGGPPQIGRSFRVKIEAFIPDPIPIGNDAEIERLISLILEAEAELDALYCAVEHYSSQGSTARGVYVPNPGGGGYTGSLPNAISQVGYPGAGDIDDCWVVATVWAANAAGYSFQPTVTQFRAWAQNPDRPGPTGGTLDHVMRGARGAWPGARIRRYASSDWNGFISLLKSGWTASLAVRSSGMDSGYRYGFNGLHQVGVAYQNGNYYLMNPLQSNGSSPRVIDGLELRTAARGFTGGTICACMFA